MLRRILSISGRPGLYNLINQGKNCLIVESLTPDKKRMPVFNNDKVMSLGDIAIYTMGEDIPLNEVMEKIKIKNDGKEIDVKALDKQGKIREEFALALPDFDDERVKTSDIKKVFGWYNILMANGITEFIAEEETPEESESEASDKQDA